MIKTIKASLLNEEFKKFLFNVHSKTQILFGGAGSSKSVHSAFKNIFRVLSGKNVLVVRKVYGTIYDSYYQELLKAVRILDLEQYFTFKKTPLRIECANGNVILFRGLDNVEKVKGIAVPKGAIDHTTMEEATEILDSDYYQLQFRSRGGSDRMELADLQRLKESIMGCVDETKLMEINFSSLLGFDNGELDNCKTNELLLNPVDINHWIYKTFFEPINFRIEDKVYNSPDLYIMHSDHWDNQFLTPDDHRKYERYRFINEYFYNVYCRGHWGVLGDVVFRKFKLARMEQDYVYHLQESGFRYGVDFGWTDAFSVIECHIDIKTRTIHILNEFSMSNVSSEQRILSVRSIVGYSQVICDSADPKSIDELALAGINAVGAYKPSGHKERAWIWLQSFLMYIDVDKCPNFSREISTYQWQKDKNGRVIQKLKDGNDHCLDAFIYSLNQEIMMAGAIKSW